MRLPDRYLWVPLLLLGGCADAPEAPAPVCGTVTYQGAPLPHGTVVFTPDPTHGNDGAQAQAAIQADGTFILQTGSQAGAVPGWHRVTVAAVVPVDPATPFTGPRTLIPEKYRDPVLSGLRVEVKPGQGNQVTLRLE